VIEGAARIVVKTKFGSFPAALVRADTINDIAVLRVSGAFRPLPIAPSRTVKLGESVITVGFPNPALQGVEPKLTDGKISSLAGSRMTRDNFRSASRCSRAIPAGTGQFGRQRSGNRNGEIVG